MSKKKKHSFLQRASNDETTLKFGDGGKPNKKGRTTKSKGVLFFGAPEWIFICNCPSNPLTIPCAANVFTGVSAVKNQRLLLDMPDLKLPVAQQSSSMGRALLSISVCFVDNPDLKSPVAQRDEAARRMLGQRPSNAWRRPSYPARLPTLAWKGTPQQ